MILCSLPGTQKVSGTVNIKVIVWNNNRSGLDAVAYVRYDSRLHKFVVSSI